MKLNNSKILNWAIFVVALLVGFCLEAFASEGEGHHAGIGSLVPFWIHFLAYAALVYWFLLRKGLPAAFKSRAERIQGQVLTGRAALDAANNALSEAQNKHAGLQSDMSRAAAQIQADGEREAALIIDDAKKRAEKSLQQAKDIARAEAKSAQSAIQREVAAAVIAEAKNRLKSEIDESSDRKLRQSAALGIKNLM